MAVPVHFTAGFLSSDCCGLPTTTHRFGRRSSDLRGASMRRSRPVYRATGVRAVVCAHRCRHPSAFTAQLIPLGRHRSRIASVLL